MKHFNKTKQINIKVNSFLDESSLGPKFQLTDIEIENIKKNRIPQAIPLKDSEEIIPSKYWWDLKSINSNNLKSLDHPVWFIIQSYVLENFKPKNKILYISNGFNLNTVYPDSDKLDIVYNSLSVIPKDFINYYPIPYFNWNTNNMTPFINTCYQKKQIENLFWFLDKFSNYYEEIKVEGDKEFLNQLKQYFPKIKEIYIDPFKLKEVIDKPIGLNISLDYTNDDLGYCIGNILTNDDIYEYWGKKNIVGIQGNPPFESKLSTKKEIRKKIKDNPSLARNLFIEDGKNNKKIPGITLEDEKYIERNYIPPLNELQGEDLALLGHPIWMITKQIFYDHFIPSSKIMTVSPCSAFKPYKNNINYMYIRERMEEGFTDVFINSCELWPLDFSTQLIARLYDWGHEKEIPFVQEALIKRNTFNILYAYKKFNFDTLIFLCQPADPKYPNNIGDNFYQIVVKILKKYIPNIKVVLDEETTKQGLDLCGSYGLLKFRYRQLKCVRLKFDKLINYDGIDPTYIPKYKIPKLY